MMLFKLALKNIKKSVRDYSIFFFTLVIAVSLLYMFNSLDAQQAMMEIEGSKSATIEMLTKILSYVSVFVSIVFGMLIIFSNTFLIKRRKQEIGLYQLLGMKRRKVLTIIALESVIVGMGSYGVGLLTGIFLSQFMSMVTAYMFRVDLSIYHFIFSFEAFKTTTFNFFVIFGIVIILNSLTLSRFKLIDLFNARKKNQNITNRPKFISILVFLLSISLIAYAYYKLFHGGITVSSASIAMLVSGAVGTFLLFYSVATFFTIVTKRNPKLYYNKLNCFVFKQISSKIRTNVLSTTVVNLLLLLTIGILSLSLAIIDSFNSDMEGINLTDVSFTNYNLSSTFMTDITTHPLFVENVYEYVDYKIYEADINFTEIMLEDVMEKYTDDFDTMILEQSKNNTPNVLKYSDYKRIIEVQGGEARTLEKGEFLIICNAQFTYKYINDFYSTKPNIILNGVNLKAESSILEEVSLKNSVSKDVTGVIVVNDDVVNGLVILNESIISNFKEDIDEEMDQLLYDSFHNINDNRYLVITSYSTDEAAISTSVTLMFVGLYLGLTFAITSATVLAIGQLTDISDNKERYTILRQLGTENKLINKALFSQIAIVFLLPLSIAIIHSYVGILKFTSIIEMLLKVNMIGSVIKTAGFIVLIYGGYLYMTYMSTKKIININD